jgi:hypothetical protein
MWYKIHLQMKSYVLKNSTNYGQTKIMMLRFWVESEEFVFVVNDIMNPIDMYMHDCSN